MRSDDIARQIETELEYLTKFSNETDKDLNPLELRDSIFLLVNEFIRKTKFKSVYNIRSVSFLCDIIHNLCLGKPVRPLSGSNKEWESIGDGWQQNIRCTDVCRKFNNTSYQWDCYYDKAVVFYDSLKDEYFTDTIGEISSRQQIKEFMFVPKTFIVPVVKYEIHDNTDIPQYTILDLAKHQDEIWNYYKRPVRFIID